jgi:hypothetical protein
MNTIGTPYRATILIHCYTGRDRPFDPQGPAFKHEIETLLSLGVIRRTDHTKIADDCYETTALGDAWVKAMCGTLLPKAAYLDEMGRVIE